MKAIGCIPLLLLFTVTALPQADAPEPDKSHFRLFAAKVDVAGNARDCLFKIDMRTGQTWRLVMVDTDNAGTIDYWRAVGSVPVVHGTNAVPDFKTLKPVHTSEPKPKP